MSQIELEISVSDAKAMQDTNDEFLFLDCREQQEFDLVHIEGTLLIPMSEIQQRLGELTGQEKRHIVVHCHHGMRSAQVVAWLRDQGFSKAQSMAGGIDAWAQEIEPGMARY